MKNKQLKSRNEGLNIIGFFKDDIMKLIITILILYLTLFLNKDKLYGLLYSNNPIDIAGSIFLLIVLIMSFLILSVRVRYILFENKIRKADYKQKKILKKTFQFIYAIIVSFCFFMVIPIFLSGMLVDVFLVYYPIGNTTTIKGIKALLGLLIIFSLPSILKIIKKRYGKKKK